MVNSDNWCMNVEGKVYGPYSAEQMRGFVEERRLAYHSLVAPAGSRDFRPALQFSELKPLFSRSSQAVDAVTTTPRTGQPLIIVFGSDAAYRQGAGVLSDLEAVMQLSGSAALVHTAMSAEALRDRMSKAIPNTERVLVFPCAESTAACYGVSLEEHERIAKLIAGAGASRF
ncbi:MAG: GYF domain-containing protein [Pseudomonadota bacterium]